MCALVAFAGGTASADPVLNVLTLANTTAAGGGTLDYFVTVSNVGTTATNGPVTMEITLPTGLAMSSVTNITDDPQWDCSSVTPGASTATCTLSQLLVPNEGTHKAAVLKVSASVDANASGTLTSSFKTSGGGASDRTVVDPTRISPTPPAFGVDSFDVQIAADPAGDPSTKAGDHPYAMTTAIMFNTLTNPNPVLGETFPVEQPKNAIVTLPPGLVADPTATGAARCTATQLAFGDATSNSTLCPPGTQVGTATVFSTGKFSFGPPIPVYNAVPPPGVPARFGFNLAGSVVTIDGGVSDDGRYTLTASARNIPDGLAIAGTVLTLWGVPADPSHDVARSCSGQPPIWSSGPSCTTEAPLRPFLRNPTSCTAPGAGLTSTLSIDSWSHPGLFKTATTTTHDLPGFPAAPEDWGPVVGTTGCDQVPFAPSLSGAPDVAAAGAPAAFSFDVTLPQGDDPNAIATGDLRKAVVTLPPGVRTSASVADGLAGCSPGQISIGSNADSTCPPASKIGTVTIDTPLLDEPLQGSIYLAQPHDNPFNSLLAVYLVARGPGVVIKLPGKITPDPSTGRIETTFDDNPQLPFSDLHLAFKGGPRAPLSVPQACGTYSTHAVLTAWSGKTVTSDSPFTVTGDGYGSPCGAPFAPQLSAGTTSVAAGKHTSLSVRLTRAESDQDLSGLTVNTPKGVTGKIAGVPLCPAANAALGACPSASRIGSVLTGAGAGPDPFYLPGKVFLTGPYKGAPYGLSVVVRALAGPFDLGTVVVRAQIQVDRHTAQLHVVSDPLPRILQGIPLQLRDVRVNVDRRGFMLNPTGCSPKRVSAIVTSAQGLVAHPSDRFQVGGCSKLPLAPKLTLTVGAKGRDRRGDSTPFSTTLTQRPGQAALKSVFVSLPATLNARLGVVQAACSQAQYLAGNCAKARAGSAVAVTPILPKPLRGSVYFVHDPTKPTGALPNLVVALRGDVSFDLIGHITVPGGRLATNFSAIPDVPISSFKLNLVAGSHGPLGALTNLCTRHAHDATASVVMRGQNGAAISRHQRLQIRGCGGVKRARRLSR